MFKKLIITILLSLLSLPSMALAASDRVPDLIHGELLPGPEKDDANDPEKINTWFQKTLIKNLINTIIGIGAALSVVVLVIGGYMYLTAMGDEEQLQQAHKTILWALLGLALALLAFAIVQVIVSIDFG